MKLGKKVPSEKLFTDKEATKFYKEYRACLGVYEVITLNKKERRMIRSQITPHDYGYMLFLDGDATNCKIGLTTLMTQINE